MATESSNIFLKKPLFIYLPFYSFLIEALSLSQVSWVNLLQLKVSLGL
jgi:hypothetical protein